GRCAGRCPTAGRPRTAAGSRRPRSSPVRFRRAGATRPPPNDTDSGRRRYLGPAGPGAGSERTIAGRRSAPWRGPPLPWTRVVMDGVVSFRGAVALLGRFPALAGVDLDVDRGEVVLVQGPNGAGKTTLLRACAGLVAVTDGSASVLGCDLRRDRRAVRP